MRPLGPWLRPFRTYWVIPVVIGWKLLLILGWRLPPPANDAFFFDGAVMHALVHGDYVNPSIARVFPTSATAYFSAYVPGYQAVLAGWMAIFGPSVAASLALHGTLCALHALLVLALFHRLRVPPGAANFGAAFLFAITFHDRPDSLAHVWGLLAFWSWTHPAARGSVRQVAGVGLIILTLATSLHIGAMYGAMLWAFATLRAGRHGWPWPGMAAMVLVPLGLAAWVVLRVPVAWAGFQENLLVTPSFTGLRWPAWDEVLKVVRNTGGLWVVAAGLLVDAARGRWVLRRTPANAAAVELFVPLAAAAFFAVVANLCIVHPNYVMIAMYPQPLVVALWLWLRQMAVPGRAERTRERIALTAALGLAALRGLALTTWGIAAAADVSQREAAAIVRQEVAALPDHAEVVVSSAYLYSLVDVTSPTLLHSDWVGRYGPGAGAALPVTFVLTPFDYHRRYQQELATLEQQGHVRVVAVRSFRRLPVPDEFPRWQRVVQHLSWAPVVVEVEWR